MKTGVMGPYGGYDIFNCLNRFGFGIGSPLERIHLGTANYVRFGSSTSFTNIGQTTTYPSGEPRT